MFNPTAYLDEAGIAIHEPVIIVAGVLVMNERQETALTLGVAELHRTFEVEQPFHLSDIWQGTGPYTKAAGWDVPMRLELAKSLLSLPYWNDTATIIAFYRRDPTRHAGPTQSRNQIVDHLATFGWCCTGIDQCMKEFAPGQTPNLVVENNNEARRGMTRLHALARGESMPVKGAEAVPGHDPPLAIGDLEFRLKDDPILQLADASCYAFSRIISGKKDRSELVSRIGDGSASPEAFDGMPFGLAVMYPYYELTPTP